MPTAVEAITQLEAAKKLLEDQTGGASGATLLKLLMAIQHIADEVGAQEAMALNAAPYVPQTDPFKAATSDAKAFLATLNNLKAIFAGIGQVAMAADTVIGMIK
jgi:hypothetical protein